MSTTVTTITSSTPGHISGSATSLFSGGTSTFTNYGGNISGSATSTASFGLLQVEGANFTSASLAGGGSSGPSATAVSGSWRGELSSSAVKVLGGGVSGSAISTGSFGRLEGDGSGLTGLSSAAISSVSNFGDNNRVITAAGAAAVNAESNLTFDGSKLTVTGQITASGTISASGGFVGDGSGLTGLSSAAISSYTNNGNNRVVTSVDANTVNGEANLTFDGELLSINSNISSSGFTVSSSNNVKINNDNTGSLSHEHGVFSVNYGNGTQATGSLTTSGKGYGDIVKFGATEGLTAGYFYYLNSSGNWAAANATDNSAGADELLAVSLGTNSDVDGMLLRGFVKITHNAVTIGRAIYMSTSAGRGSDSAPSSTNNIVRVLGYAVGHADGFIYFNPDSTWVKIA